MLRKIISFILAMVSLLLAVLVNYTPLFGIDFTKLPEILQVFASWIFFMGFALFILYMGWSFYAEK